MDSASVSYQRAPDLGVVAAYFNPCGYSTKERNLAHFAEPLLRAGIPLIVAEAVFDEGPFSLPENVPGLRVRARDVMWQKERLLNLAIAALPSTCTKVAWLDADVLFERSDWAVETSQLLERFPVVQPFAEVVRLPRGHDRFLGEGERWESFAQVYAREPQLLMNGDFARHGHTGFAWAARRDVLAKNGLYDACIAGSGDHMMAHAFCGDWESRCIARIIGSNNKHLAFFRTWSRGLYKDVRARVSAVPGRLVHLWHGEMANRRYVLRNQELAAFGFDPAGDVKVGASGCWEWSSDKRDLHQWARRYFELRREDEGEPENNSASLQEERV
jgi:hypothetical protein